MSWQRDWTVTAISGDIKAFKALCDEPGVFDWASGRIPCPAAAEDIEVYDDGDEAGIIFSSDTGCNKQSHGFIAALLEECPDTGFHIHMYEHGGYWFDVDLKHGEDEKNWREGTADLYGEESVDHVCGNCRHYPGHDGDWCREADHPCASDDCDGCGLWAPF